MAKPSHSRFTDEVFCTPVPSASLMEVKKTDELVDGIFTSESHRQFQAGLIAAEEFNSKELYEKYPPQLNDKNKRFLLDLLNHKGHYSPASNKSILMTRWKPFIPFIESDQSVHTEVHFQADVFSYTFDNVSQTVEWYLNFANSDIFAYYGGPLLAQDELQVLECIELGALRQYLIQATNTVGSRTVGSDAHINKSVPTPILISNTERAMSLDTKEIYGNAFVKANEEQLEKAFTAIQPSQAVNLIAIEAPSHGQGHYTREQIQYILTACYTGFKAAQILGNKTHGMNAVGSSRGDVNALHTIIHTGWWGCGAYGNNRQMMLITQIVAAHWAQVDQIVFHTQTNEHQNDIDKAKEIAHILLESKQVEEVMDKIFKLNLEWEKSNNT